MEVSKEMEFVIDHVAPNVVAKEFDTFWNEQVLTDQLELQRTFNGFVLLEWIVDKDGFESKNKHNRAEILFTHPPTGDPKTIVKFKIYYIGGYSMHFPLSVPALPENDLVKLFKRFEQFITCTEMRVEPLTQPADTKRESEPQSEAWPSEIASDDDFIEIFWNVTGTRDSIRINKYEVQNFLPVAQSLSNQGRWAKTANVTSGEDNLSVQPTESGIKTELHSPNWPSEITSEALLNRLPELLRVIKSIGYGRTFSEETTKKIILAIPATWNKGYECKPKFVKEFCAGVSSNTISRFVSKLRQLGISKIDDAEF